MAGKCKSWDTDKDGRLAAAILLDQFSRQLFRKNPKAFSADAKALQNTLKLLKNRSMFDEYTYLEKMFLLMPLEHDENPKHTKQMITEIDTMTAKLKADYPDKFDETYKGFCEKLRKFAVDHDAIVQKYGRYPHRNEVLGRQDTPEEVEYLKTAERYG